MKRTEGVNSVISGVFCPTVLVCTLVSCVIFVLTITVVLGPAHTLAKQILVIFSAVAIAAALLNSMTVGSVVIRRREASFWRFNRRAVSLLVTLAVIIGLVIVASFFVDWGLSIITFVLVFINASLFFLLILFPE